MDGFHDWGAFWRKHITHKVQKKKLRLTRADIIYENYVCGDQKLINHFNQRSLDWFLDKSNIDLLSKSITNYIFRKGPVEKLHSNKKLTESDMKTLNVFMVNQTAGLLQCALDGEWMRLRTVFSGYSDSVSEWQEAKSDLTGIKKFIVPVEIADEKILTTLKRYVILNKANKP